MKNSETIDIINEVENQFPVDQWVVGGVHLWPLLRINMSFQLFDFSRNSNKVDKKKHYSTNVKKIQELLSIPTSYINATLKDHEKNTKPKKGFDAVFLNHSTCRLFAVNGKMFDVFCDPFINILNGLNIKSFVMEFAPGNEYRISRYNGSMFIDMDLFLLRIKAFLSRGNMDNSTNFANDYGCLKEYLFRRVDGFSLGEVDRIYRQVHYIRLVADYFKNIFSVLEPRMGFVVTYYSSFGMAFNLACRESGIPSIDIQHGVQGALHPAYGRWHRLPAKGYELLPAFFLSWSEKEAGAIEEWNKEVADWHSPVVLGNLYMHMFREDNNPIVQYYRLKINDIINNAKRKLNILITLQPGYGLTSVFKDAIATAPGSWFWWVRLHPGMHKEKDKILKELMELHVDNFNVKDASELPLYAMLPQMDVHVTGWSSTVIEAAQFGVPSVVTHIDGRELYSDLISSGVAGTAFTKDELIMRISDQADRKKSHRWKSDSEYPDYESSISALRFLVSEFCYQSSVNANVGE
jgi:hypothetical protein